MTGRFCAFGIALAGLLAANPAVAQDVVPATTDQADKGQVIASFYYSKSSRGFDADGNSIDIADYEKVELFLLAEYEIVPDLTLIFKPSFRGVSVEGGDDDSGLGYTDIGGRYRFAESQDGWFAVETTVRIPGVSRDDNLAQVGSTDAEYDFRLRGFHNLALGNSGGFVDAQASYRLRDGDPPNEFHADVTLGYRPDPDFLLMAQSFNTISDGAGQGIFDEYRYHNLQLSGVLNVSRSVALQAGLMGTIAGENALRERGFFGGVWVSF
ncbi:transporter [Qipengyuania qiaonensis]|uniref:Transporter n=1 Tax=Qipengyuania qiaonensis TaxID=2867240 RepID=A0ABS7J0S1_9SPHN|nr:transporter [Qipengyuania qiaonensis]MBX7480935.1 transporter [Qipengyuania qiaonensis]